MKKLLSLLLISSSLFAQSPYIKETVKTLCSEEFHGRGYVNKGDSIAARFIAREFDSFGLKPMFNNGYFQPFSFEVNTFPGEQIVEINGDRFTPGEDYIIDPSSKSFEGKRKVIYLNHEDLESIKDGSNKDISIDKLKEKIVVLDSRGANENDKKLLRKLSVEMTRYSPVVYLNCEKLTWSVAKASYVHPRIEMYCDKLPKRIKKVFLSIENENIDVYETQNVGAFIDNPNTEKTILFTAHYDHLGRMGSALFPGANDNASGTALVLDIARKLVKSDLKLNADIGFLLFAGEEAGLKGSKYFTEDPPINLDSIRFVLNLDIMGTGDEGITVVNAIEQAEAFNLLTEINNFNKFLPTIKKRKQTSNSDHYWFSQNEVPAVFIYTMGGVSFYHDVFDKAETLPLDYTDKISELLFIFCQEITN